MPKINEYLNLYHQNIQSKNPQNTAINNLYYSILKDKFPYMQKYMESILKKYKQLVRNPVANQRAIQELTNQTNKWYNETEIKVYNTLRNSTMGKMVGDQEAQILTINLMKYVVARAKQKAYYAPSTIEPPPSPTPQGLYMPETPSSIPQ